MVDWAGLHYDLLNEIGKHLTSIESYDFFGLVCKSWRAAASRDKHYLKQKTFQGPWLLLAEKESPTDVREFFNVSCGKTRKIFLPEASKKRCLSYKDWLCIIEDDLIHTSLLHLPSHVQIDLPKLDTFPDYEYHSFEENIYFIKGVVISANPSSTSDFMVMVVWGARFQLGFCKTGDTSWTAIDEWQSWFSNIIYYNNKLYALDLCYRLVRCDVNGPYPTRLHRAFDLPPTGCNYMYLFEFSKKFCVVCRYEDQLKTTTFKVYEVKIDGDDDDDKWVEIKNLGNKALFLSYNSSFLIECSEINNFKSNCIYFLEDNTNEYFGSMCIYHLSDESIESLFDEDKVCYNIITAPRWIGPKF